ncbi:UNVERIFIED_CONTAM: hypothetical protein Cloal_1504 [Acetivibrio alkalicellulosi]
MKKIMLIVISITIMGTIFFSCQEFDNDEYSKKAILKVRVYKVINFNELKLELIAEYDEKEKIEIFKKAISDASKITGIVNIIDTNFKFEIVYEDERKDSYYLWLGEKGQKGSLMNIEDTDIIYSISENLTDNISKLIRD